MKSRGERPKIDRELRRLIRRIAAEIAAIDFFVVPTATFRLLYVLLVLPPDRRRVVHFNVTVNPSAAWTAQQIVGAFPFDSAPKYLVRDNDGIYGRVFTDRIE